MSDLVLEFLLTSFDGGLNSPVGLSLSFDGELNSPLELSLSFDGGLNSPLELSLSFADRGPLLELLLLPRLDRELESLFLARGLRAVLFEWKVKQSLPLQG